MKTQLNIEYLVGIARLKRIEEKLHSDCDLIYSQMGVPFKVSWFTTYHALAKASKALTMQEITASIGFTHITAKNIVRELEKNGLVKITVNPNDARSKLVKLTPKAITLGSKLNSIWRSFSQAMEQILTSGHPDLINILSRIEQEIDREPLALRVGALTTINK